MSVSNNKSTTSNKRNKRNKISKRPKSNDRLSFATWVLLIISFTLLGYALYVIQTRILETNTENAKATTSVIQQSKQL